MATFTHTTYIYFDTQQNTLISTQYNFWAHDVDPETPNVRHFPHTSVYLLHTTTTEFESDFDPFVARLEGLESALKKERLDSAVRQANLQQQIDELKAIGYDHTNDPHISTTEFPDYPF